MFITPLYVRIPGFRHRVTKRSLWLLVAVVVHSKDDGLNVAQALQMLRSFEGWLFWKKKFIFNLDIPLLGCRNYMSNTNYTSSIHVLILQTLSRLLIDTSRCSVSVWVKHFHRMTRVTWYVIMRQMCIQPDLEWQATSMVTCNWLRAR